jgi:hypothetical protein
VWLDDDGQIMCGDEAPDLVKALGTGPAPQDRRIDEIRALLEEVPAETPAQKTRREMDEAVASETLRARGFRWTGDPASMATVWREHARFLLAEVERRGAVLVAEHNRGESPRGGT